MQTWLIARPRRLATLICSIALLALLGAAWPGNDYRPLRWGLLAELGGRSAYGPEVAAQFERIYASYCEGCVQSGFAYPLPAIWLALPLVPLPEGPDVLLWSVLAGGSVLLGMVLLRMPLPLLLFLPLILGLQAQQATVLLVGLLLIGVWAYRERRWWLLGLVIALALPAKPQASGLIAAALLLPLLRARAWLPLGLLALSVGLTFVLEPSWPQQWFQRVTSYRAELLGRSLLAWLPVALLLLALRRPWAGLAVLQVCLFPVVYGYAFLPLLVGYVDTASARVAWLAVGSALLLIPLLLLADAVGLGATWLIYGVAYLGPLLLAQRVGRRQPGV